MRGIISDKEITNLTNCRICKRGVRQDKVRFFEIFNIDHYGNSLNIHICERCLKDLREPLEIVDWHDTNQPVLEVV